MVLVRSHVLRSAAQQLARPVARSSFRSAGRQQPWQRIAQSVSRRGYASSHGEAGHGQAKSDLPWAIGAVAFTVPGVWYMLQPGEAHHADHHEAHEEKHEEPKQEEAPKEEPKEEPKAEAKEESKEEPKEESKEESKDDSKDESKDKPKEDSKDESKEEPKKDESPKEESKEEAPKEDSKSDTDAKGSAKDKPAASKEALSQNQTSGKQQGLSNTDTKHSTDVDNDPSKSKKSEGSVDTAKSKGTISPNRPAV